MNRLPRTFAALLPGYRAETIHQRRWSDLDDAFSLDAAEGDIELCSRSRPDGSGCDIEWNNKRWYGSVIGYGGSSRDGASADTADFICEIQGDRGQDMVPRATTHEKIHDGTMRIVVAPIPAGCPPDDFELVIIALPVVVAARIGQPAWYDVSAHATRELPATRRGGGLLYVKPK